MAGSYRRSSAAARSVVTAAMTSWVTSPGLLVGARFSDRFAFALISLTLDEGDAAEVRCRPRRDPEGIVAAPRPPDADEHRGTITCATARDPDRGRARVRRESSGPPISRQTTPRGLETSDDESTRRGRLCAEETEKAQLSPDAAMIATTSVETAQKAAMSVMFSVTGQFPGRIRTPCRPDSQTASGLPRRPGHRR